MTAEPPPPTDDPGYVDALLAEADAEAPVDGTRLPADFWRERPVLAHILTAARSWPVGPDGLLGAILARVAVAHGPELGLHPRGSLNLLAVLIAESGGGKSATQEAADELLPLDHRSDLAIGVPLGSGEGVADTYLGPARKDQDANGNTVWRRDQIIRGALFSVDEGQVIAQLASRSGATLLPVLRTAWSGGTLGAKNAAADRDRRLPAGRYRFAAIIGLQPDHAVGLLDDVAGGTPQRLLWLRTTDPTFADLDRLPEWPGPIDLATPSVAVGEKITQDPAVRDEIARNRLLTVAGTRIVDPLDAHRDLLRLKVAALLALLDQRRHVTEDDWRLAGMILVASTGTRSMLVELQHRAARQAAERRIGQKVAEAGAVARTAEDKALIGGARAIARKVHRTPADELPVRRRDLHHAVASNHRALVPLGDMLEHAIGERWIEPTGDGTYRPGESRPA